MISSAVYSPLREAVLFCFSNVLELFLRRVIPAKETNGFHKEPDMNLDAPAMPLGVNLTTLKDEEGQVKLCYTVCLLSSMKDCGNCKQIRTLLEEKNVS
jgi:hypothetical protein